MIIHASSPAFFFGSHALTDISASCIAVGCSWHILVTRCLYYCSCSHFFLTVCHLIGGNHCFRTFTHKHQCRWLLQLRSEDGGRYRSLKVEGGCRPMAYVTPAGAEFPQHCFRRGRFFLLEILYHYTILGYSRHCKKAHMF